VYSFFLILCCDNLNTCFHNDADDDDEHKDNDGDDKNDNDPHADCGREI